MRNVHIIVDLQFGSTGKGLLAGYLAEKFAPDTLVTAWGPNAGHTYIDAAGRKFVNIALPNGIVSQNLKRILIGPGSVIDPDRFRYELNEYHDLIRDRNVEVLIHEHAAVVTQYHKDLEAEYGFRIGSTMKGVGEAVVQKIKRGGGLPNIARTVLDQTLLLGARVVSKEEYNMAMDQGREVLIEGAQGFSLGINNGYYPYTTSRECTVQQLMVDCAIPMSWVDDFMVYGSMRTFPIRVANRFKDGVQVGTSGPGYPDQREIEWADIGREPELTTVTKLPRRLFTFSREQIRQALRMNECGGGVFLNFVNYLRVSDGRYPVEPYARAVRDAGSHVRWIGTGPTINDIMEV